MQWKRENDYLIRVPKTGRMEIDALIFASRQIKVEPGSLEQLRAAASIPTVRHALGMSDIHQGYGVPIGSVVATQDAVVPAAVGYDINCGMRLLLTDLSAAEVDLEDVARAISRRVPLGEGKSNVRLGKEDFATVLEGGLAGIAEIGHGGHEAWEFLSSGSANLSLERVEDRGSMEGSVAAVPPRAVERGIDQLGTLGGGNHFIELQAVQSILDPETAERFGIFKGQFAIMIHSGSRGLGHEVGGHYMKAAKNWCDKHGGACGPGLSHLPGDDKSARDYLGAMAAAANFAFANRAFMGALVEKSVKERYPDATVRLLYDVPHNIAKQEEHNGRLLLVHRKGSTRAWDKQRMNGTIFSDVGQPVLIPGSMGTASYVLTGLPTGSASLFSVNHGAGRTMSRSEAAGGRKGRGGKKRQAAISDDEFKRSMKGILLIAADKRAAKEEAPAAYKDIDQVIETVSEAGLARTVARLKPRAVLKG